MQYNAHASRITKPALLPGHRLGDPPPRRIAVFRALQLGDMLCAVPALRALRAALPRAHITLIGLPWAQAFVQRFHHYLDDFIEFPGAPGLPERLPLRGELLAFIMEARQRRFDLAIQLHGSGAQSNRVVAALGAKVRAGFFPNTGRCPDAERFLGYPEHESEVQRLLQLMAFLGIPPWGEMLEFPITDQDRREFARIELAEQDAYVCIHPGARAPARRWPPERFAAVADELATQGLRVVLTGSASENFLTAAVAQTMRTPSINLAGRTSLGALAVLLENARLLVCSDTGVSHLAAALRTPSIVIFTASSPERWAPLNGSLHKPVFHPFECRPCEHAVCPIGHPCAGLVTPGEVVREAMGLLERSR